MTPLPPEAGGRPASQQLSADLLADSAAPLLPRVPVLVLFLRDPTLCRRLCFEIRPPQPPTRKVGPSSQSEGCLEAWPLGTHAHVRLLCMARSSHLGALFLESSGEKEDVVRCSLLPFASLHSPLGSSFPFLSGVPWPDECPVPPLFFQGCDLGTLPRTHITGPCRVNWLSGEKKGEGKNDRAEGRDFVPGRSHGMCDGGRRGVLLPQDWGHC